MRAFSLRNCRHKILENSYPRTISPCMLGHHNETHPPNKHECTSVESNISLYDSHEEKRKKDGDDDEDEEDEPGQPLIRYNGI